MSVRRWVFHRLAPALDRVMPPLVWAAAQQMLLIRRLTPPRMPRAMAMLDRVGVYPLIDHYYEPLINMRRLRHRLSAVRDLPGIAIDDFRALALLAELREMAELDAAPEAPQAGSELDYYARNDFFGPLDAGVLYALIRRHKPRRILEVGCGMSTRAAIAARSRNAREDPGYACEHVCIEPYEQPWLADAPVRLLRSTAEESDPALVADLEAGDILFIDSSHVIRPQGDVLTLILNWLARVRPGVLVHVHDIFTPRDYPEDLLRLHRFFWNEQYLLEAFLSFNRDYEVLLPLNHLFETHPDAVRAACPRQFAEWAITPGSFWICRKK